MKYKGYYLTLFVPMIKKSISVRFGKELAEKAVGNGKDEYRKLLQNALELGNNNPMASSAYFAYVFVCAWLGTNKEISICSYLNSFGLGEIMRPLCETDKYMFAYQHGTLYREHTIADGAEICDYWIVGDRLSDPE